LPLEVALLRNLIILKIKNTIEELKQEIKNLKKFKVAEISILSMPNPVDNLPEN